MSRIRPANYTLVIPQRATFEEDITLKADGLPLNLTGYTVVAQIWKDEKRRHLIVDLVVTYVDRVAGKILLSLPRSVTRTINKSGFWDLLVIEPGGAADYWLEGTATVDIGLSDDQ